MRKPFKLSLLNCVFEIHLLSIAGTQYLVGDYLCSVETNGNFDLPQFSNEPSWYRIFKTDDDTDIWRFENPIFW